MPIYEFKCLTCQDCFEFLTVSADEKIEMKCPKCGGEDIERVMSATNFQMGAQATGTPASTSTSRTCSAGTCTTWEAPGPAK